VTIEASRSPKIFLTKFFISFFQLTIINEDSESSKPKFYKITQALESMKLALVLSGSWARKQFGSDAEWNDIQTLARWLKELLLTQSLNLYTQVQSAEIISTYFGTFFTEFYWMQNIRDCIDKTKTLLKTEIDKLKSPAQIRPLYVPDYLYPN
jgi:hypothetical protein